MKILADGTYSFSSYMRLSEISEVTDWCVENFGRDMSGRWHTSVDIRLGKIYYHFRDLEDSMAFKLMWL